LATKKNKAWMVQVWLLCFVSKYLSAKCNSLQKVNISMQSFSQLAQSKKADKPEKMNNLDLLRNRRFHSKLLPYWDLLNFR
jgi:hypothetical protein